MHYYLIVALQAFCIYHLYKNKNEIYWYFLIIFIPILGSLIYIIVKVYNRRDADKIQQELTTIINPTKHINDLIKKLEFSETFQNKVNLADAYFDMGGFKNAINHYEDAIRTTKFLLDNEKNEDGRALLTELQQEARYMIKANKRNYSATIREVEQLLREL